jgi:hypothetical protein
LTPLKVIHPWPALMSCTMEVVLPTSRIPQGNISRVLSCPIRQTLNLPPVYPALETNHKLMSKSDKFAAKHRTHSVGLTRAKNGSSTHAARQQSATRQTGAPHGWAGATLLCSSK